ncbi:MAG: glycerol-3-phosphate dehydrogenase, partial [Clostridia bacterium]|nr:glycerol-3-phosphate dehydrogenase [Clostridia bacterium]
FYYGNDLLGTEIGAAAKNVMGIAAGILDVICVPLKGPLMARGAREVARLIKAMGGNELSAYGLAHLGDYETTLFSPYSHNRTYGEMLAKGERFEKLAEGVATSGAMRLLGKQYGVELPITEAVYNVCYGGGDDALRCRQEIGKLFSRSMKAEIY